MQIVNPLKVREEGVKFTIFWSQIEEFNISFQVFALDEREILEVGGLWSWELWQKIYFPANKSSKRYRNMITTRPIDTKCIPKWLATYCALATLVSELWPSVQRCGNIKSCQIIHELHRELNYVYLYSSFFHIFGLIFAWLQV